MRNQWFYLKFIFISFLKKITKNILYIDLPLFLQKYRNNSYVIEIKYSDFNHINHYPDAFCIPSNDFSRILEQFDLNDYLILNIDPSYRHQLYFFLKKNKYKNVFVLKHA